MALPTAAHSSDRVHGSRARLGHRQFMPLGRAVLFVTQVSADKRPSNCCSRFIICAQLHVCRRSAMFPSHRGAWTCSQTRSATTQVSPEPIAPIVPTVQTCSSDAFTTMPASVEVDAA